jgi:hypothetical protein
MVFNSVDGRKVQKRLQGDHHQTDIVELTQDRKKIWSEIQGQDQVRDSGHREHLEEGRNPRFPEQPGAQSDTRYHRPEQRRARQP